jgi:hypothetical protein
MSNPLNDPNLSDGLKQLLRQGFPLLATGATQGLVGIPGAPRPHIFDGIDGPAQAALKTLANTTPFQLRDIVQLYKYVDNNLDNTINICQRCQAQGTTLAAILADAQAQTDQAGQKMDPEAIEIGVQVSEAGRVHVEFNKPVQFLVLTSQGARGLIASLQEALGEL